MENETKNTAIAFFAHATILLIAWIAENNFHTGHLKLAFYFTLAGLVITTVILNVGRIRAHLRQLFVAKLRGFWQDEGLNKQIKKYFNQSEVIKIKVTRGSIFTDTNNAFYKCIMEKNKYTSTTKKIEILLHYPCKNSSHIQTRATAHLEDNIQYLGKLYKIIQNLLEAKKNFNLNLSIRLYGDQQIKWRYYIFQHTNENKTMFFGYYNDHKSGPLTPMLKIKGTKNSDSDKQTLCNDFDKAFDYAFQEKSFQIEEVFNSDIDERKKCLECFRDSTVCQDCHNTFQNKIKGILETFGLKTTT